MIRRPPRSTQSRSSAASDVYKRQIRLYTSGDDHSIDVNNSGPLTVTGVFPSVLAFNLLTVGDNSPIDVVNSGDIQATSTSNYRTSGIDAWVNAGSPLSIETSGDITVTATVNAAAGIYGYDRHVAGPNAG